MSPTWRIDGGIWRLSVFGEHGNMVRRWSAIIGVAALLGAWFGAFVTEGEVRGLVLGFGGPMTALSLLYWMRYIPGAVTQNSPANARLVPGLHRAVRRTTALAWCLSLAPVALVACVMEEGAQAFVVMSLVFTSMGLGLGGRWTGWLIFMLLQLGFLAVGRDTGVSAWLASAPVMAAAMLCSVALAWDGLRTVFPSGGERHWKLLSSQAKQRVSGDLGQSLLHSRSSGKQARIYAVLLRRDLRAVAHPERLLLHALGPHNHRHDLVVPLVGAALLALVVKLLVVGNGLMSDALVLEIGGSFAIPLLFLQGLSYHRMVVSIENSRGEQALVRLAPRSPQASRLGRALAGQLLRIALAEWFVCGAAMFGAVVLFNGSHNYLVTLATLMCTILALTGWILRDYTGKTRGGVLEVVVQTVLMGAGGIALFLVRGNPELWALLLVLMLLCAYAIISGRWKKMLDAPVPFPAGRFE